MKLLQSQFARRLVVGGMLAIVVLAGSISTPVRADSGTVTARQYYITNTDAAVPVRMAPRAGTYATSVTLVGNRLWQTTNTGTVYIGPNSTNGAQAIAITTGQIVTLSFTPAQWVDLYDWYLDVATTNDGVCVIYTK